MNLDRLRQVLPDLDELRPLWEFAAGRSSPDPARTWSASGELGTLGSRLVDPADVAGAADELAAEEGRRLAELYRILAEAAARVAAGDPASAASALVEASELEESSARYGRAEAYALAAVEVAEGLRDRRPRGRALRRAARAARSQGRFSAAADRYREAFGVARDSFDARGAAEAAIGMGNVLEQQGDWPGAEGWYRRALEVLEEVDEPVPERWHALLNIHITLRSRGRLDECRAWLERAEREAEAAGDPEAGTYLANARGQLHMASGAFSRAEDELRRALDVADSAAASVVVRVNLAETLLARGRLLEASDEAREAERRAVVSGVFPRLPEVYRLLGRIAAEEGNPEAFVFFERALEIVEERGLPALEEAVTLQAYGEMEAGLGDGERARELKSRARARYRELGIDHPRGPWSDTFGPATSADTSEEKDDED